ncbi:uncharacterized protein BKCO1_6100039 [Diplodia corticola]|uniref:Uncharacterized protein n=1 Tax=Diplodia corticola TaxID=236234 RepID=A0A1J9RPN4_9PEZI|nr:uncharacterized protein BKCO1_6100039 [Diplodia corticola]OJD30423.1 hypothetical protein BKCO1_6100039 [Diplodia corticola]
MHSVQKVVNLDVTLATLHQQLVEMNRGWFMEEALDNSMVLYRYKLKGFIARVQAENVIECHLITPLTDSPVSSVALMKLSEDGIRYFAAESEHVSIERAGLSAIQNSLEMGEKLFEMLWSDGQARIQIHISPRTIDELAEVSAPT